MGVALLFALSLDCGLIFAVFHMTFRVASRTLENEDKEGDDYYGSEVRIRFVKQKHGNIFNCVR
jgi:hypothetical protein